MTAAAIDALTAVAVAYIIASGLFLTYGLFKIINLAHGDMIMLGAYISCLVASNGGGFIAGFVIAVVALSFVGLLIESVVLRKLIGRSDLSTLLGTWGLGLCISELIRITFGPEGRFVDAPITTAALINGMRVPHYHLFLILAAFVLSVVIHLLLNRTSIGLHVRAVIDSQSVAANHGIDARPIRRLVFVASAGLAGAAGALISPLASVTPYMGTELTVDSFVVVTVGGMDSSLAPVLGASVVGGLRSVFDASFGVTASRIAVLVFTIIAILIRPYGLVSSRTSNSE